MHFQCSLSDVLRPLSISLVCTDSTDSGTTKLCQHFRAACALTAIIIPYFPPFLVIDPNTLHLAIIFIYSTRSTLTTEKEKPSPPPS